MLIGLQPDKQISQIEKSVTHLLVATKQLLETLTQWSRNQAQEEEVSDVYVRLGYEFNLACRAFNSIGVETSDLGPVPDLLRAILEDTLSQPASPQALDNYLPRIRDIIINLLHGLKRKQSKLRSRPSKDGPMPGRSGPPGRQSSVASVQSNETGLTAMLEGVPNQAPSMRSESRQESMRYMEEPALSPTNASGPQEEGARVLNRQSLRRDNSRPFPQSDSSSTMSSTTAQSLPVLPPYPNEEQVKSMPEVPFPHPPPPPPKQDALSALQRGGDLERRASRRFSAYQIQKHLGASPNGVPVIPPAQNSPIPNRGREVRESMNAVRSRTTYQQSRTKSSQRLNEASPSRSGTIKGPQRISEEREEPPNLTLQDVPRIAPPTGPMQDDSPTMKTPEEFHRPLGSLGSELINTQSPIVGATINGPLSPPPASVEPLTESEIKPPPHEHQQPIETSVPHTTPQIDEHKGRNVITPPPTHAVDLDSSPPQGKELTLFLQYKSKIKKFILTEGYDELTIARLQLAFIEKFAWNTHNNGVDLPEIYIQDPVSGVRHELEELSDVKDRSVLVLNVEVLDEVKKHFDDGIGDLRQTLDSVRSLLDGQNMMMHRFSDRQLETSKEMARISAVPSQYPSHTPAVSGEMASSKMTTGSLQEVQNLRRDIAVLRQTYSTMSADFAVAMTDIKSKAANVKSAAKEAIRPSYEGDAGRAHINKGKKQLSRDSEALISRVDEIADIIEDLRKDVVTRGVRPLPRQLEDISKNISSTTKELARMDAFIKREKPVWTKIWEHELNLVCLERDDLTQQEELMGDLHGDLSDVVDVFKLVEEATKQQQIQQNGERVGSLRSGLRSTSRNLDFTPEVDPHQAKDGVLGEVRALKPNHENRLEAIERAERLRQRELENRKGGEFQREVEKFVEEGKLKKTGGMDEVERVRMLKDERARKENFELLQARQAERERKAAEEAALAAQANQNGDFETQDANETSQEGEAAFQDASETTLPRSDGSTPSPRGTRGDEGRSRSSGPPVLPEVNLDGVGNSGKTNGMSTMND